jgi:hypothetical protein
MCTILPQQDHDDFVGGNGAVAQNLPAPRAEGEIDDGGGLRVAEMPPTPKEHASPGSNAGCGLKLKIENAALAAAWHHPAASPRPDPCSLILALLNVHRPKPQPILQSRHAGTRILSRLLQNPALQCRLRNLLFGSLATFVIRQLPEDLVYSR